MRRFKSMPSLICTFLLMNITLVSCLKEDNAPYSKLALTTLRLTSDKDMYFTLDDQSTLYPSHIANIPYGSYTKEDGQRVFIGFDQLEEPKPGYNYNIDVKAIRDVLTKDIIDLTNDIQDSIGHDPINIIRAWTTREYITIEFQYLGTNSPQKKHMLNLVVNKTEKEKNTPNTDYLELELRHNLETDEPRDLYEGYVCFKLNHISSQITDKKGLRIKTNTLYDGEQTYDIDFPTEQ